MHIGHRVHRRRKLRQPRENGTQAERWDGTTWTTQTTPAPPIPGGAALSKASCTSATACEAVGQRTVANGSTHTLAERWNGTTWSVQTTPPPLGKLATLNGVRAHRALSAQRSGSVSPVGGTHCRFDWIARFAAVSSASVTLSVVVWCCGRGLAPPAERRPRGAHSLGSGRWRVAHVRSARRALRRYRCC